MNPVIRGLSDKSMGRLISTMLLFVLGGCGVGHITPDDVIYTGEQAQSRLTFCDREKLPASINDLWVYDGGSFNGMIYYVSFKCDTLEDCWTAVRAFGAPEESDFVRGVQTKFAVNQHGPSFYSKNLQHPQWDVANIANGVFYEWSRDDRVMTFWAIDLDRLCVYFHHESGGFPDDPPSVRHRF